MILIAAMLGVAACGSRQADKAASPEPAEYAEQREPGDSTIYGLACDGCTDTILVLLPPSGEDPDTFNILGAMEQHQVFGRPEIGDKMAVVLSGEDSTVASIVIDLERLKGGWCYMVKPQLRQRAGLDMRRMQELYQQRDSIWQQLMKLREYGMEIRGDYTAHSIGVTYSMTADDKSPVVYPPQKHYREWRIFNGRLILKETRRDTAGVVTVVNTDTAEFVTMRRDTLALRFSDGTVQGYYRKLEEKKLEEGSAR